MQALFVYYLCLRFSAQGLGKCALSETRMKDRKKIKKLNTFFNSFEKKHLSSFIITSLMFAIRSERSLGRYTSINDDAISIRFDQYKDDSLTVSRQFNSSKTGEVANPGPIANCRQKFLSKLKWTVSEWILQMNVSTLRRTHIIPAMFWVFWNCCECVMCACALFYQFQIISWSVSVN